MARGELAAWSANSGEVPPWLQWGKNGEYALTEAQSTRLNDGGDRGEHSEALGERSNAFLQR